MNLVPAAARTALRTLTVLPVAWDPREATLPLSRALPWFPAVAIVPGALAALVLAAPGPVLPRSVLAAALAIGITGALHEDGVADCADAAFATVPPARRHEILRDPRVGAFGVVAIALHLLFRTAAYASLAHPLAAIAGAVTGRWVMVCTLAWFEPFRTEGLGAGFARGARAGAASIVAIAVLLPLALRAGPVRTGVGAMLGLAAGLSLAAMLARRFGGANGDVHGAAGAIAESAALIAWLQ